MEHSSILGAVAFVDLYELFNCRIYLSDLQLVIASGQVKGRAVPPVNVPAIHILLC